MRSRSAAPRRCTPRSTLTRPKAGRSALSRWTAPSVAPAGVGRALWLLAALTASLSTTACGEDAETAESNPHPSLELAVDSRGPWGAGHRSFEHTYLPVGETEQRTIVVDIWYPTEDASGDPPVYVGGFTDEFAFEGASLAAPIEPKGYPVHVYSHGDRGWAGTSGELMSYYASHGWVAVAPNHTGNLFYGNITPRPTTTYVTRPQDITAALDAVEALPSSDPLAGRLQTSSVVMSGHSFGTFTAWALAGAEFDVDAIRAECPSAEGTCSDAQIAALSAGFRDPRVVAAIPMAGGASSDWFGSLDTADIPMMLMSASGDPVGADALFASVSQIDLTWIEVAGGCHQLFALGNCSDIPNPQGPALVDTYALAFGRHHVLGDQGETTLKILDGSQEVSSLVTFKRNQP